MSVQVAAIYLQALVNIEIYALLWLSWDRYSELCRLEAKSRRYWSNFIWNLHQSLGNRAYFYNPFVFIRGQRPIVKP